MNLDLSESQKLLVESARNFLRRECSSYVVRQAQSRGGFSGELWRMTSELGWPGIFVNEEFGGMGGDVQSMVLLQEQCGRFLAPIPLASNAICATAIEAIGSPSQKSLYLPEIASGRSIWAFALMEPSGGRAKEDVQSRATKSDDGWTLEGCKLFVRDGAIADRLLVAARTSDSVGGISLFTLNADHPGVRITGLDTTGADRQAEIQFNDVQLKEEALVGPLNEGWSTIRTMLLHGMIYECAELVGVGQEVLEKTVTYANARIQFGRPIGSFQAVQHKCADMSIWVEGARYSTYLAASAMTAHGAVESDLEVTQAMAWTSERIMAVARHAQQILAGVGYMKDHDLHLYYNRAKNGELYYGAPQSLLEHIGATLLWDHDSASLLSE